MIERKLAIQILEYQIGNADKRIADFKVKFEEDPAYALDWCDSVFEAVATKEVFEKYHGALIYEELEETDEEKVDRLREHAERDMRMKLIPTRSTSFVRNEMDRERGRAYLELLEILEGRRC